MARLLNVREVLAAAGADKAGYYGGANVAHRFVACIGLEELWIARNRNTGVERAYVVARAADGTPLEECPKGSVWVDEGNPVYFVRHYGSATLPQKWQAVTA